MELLCIKSHSKGVVKAGQVYEVIDTDVCTCGMVSYDVGIRSPSPMTLCPCGKEYYVGYAWYVGASLFAQIGEVDELEAYMEKVEVRK